MVARQRVVGEDGHVSLGVVLNGPDHVRMQSIVVDENLRKEERLGSVHI